MKIIVDNYLFEALKPSEFRGLMQVGRDLAMKRIGGIWDKLKSQADSTNRNGDRLFFEISASPLEDKLHRYLKANNYEIVDYKGGLVKKIGDKNNVKIVKVLTMLGKNDPTASKLQRNYELLKSVNKLNDYDSAKSESAVAEDYIMVISKSPYDLGGMSTDREWRSCMNLRDGSNKRFVPLDIQRGTLVSYLVDPTDKNIKNPIGRILIKPYVEIDDQDEVLYGIQHDRVKYGKDNPEYVKTLVNVLDKAQEEKTGVFRLDDKLYADAGRQFTVSNSKDVSPERLLEHFGIKNYTINDDGTVDVNGKVDLFKEGLTEIPIKFGVVRGDFDVRFNNLLSLKNSPRVVTGSFNCSYNYDLSSLKYGPKSVKNYYCHDCDLKSIEGAPNEVTGEFNCSYNENLTSLKDGPKIVGIYKCNSCGLKSSEGLPNKVTEFFEADDQIGGYEFTEEEVGIIMPNYSIIKELKKYKIKNYIINEDGTVDVEGDVDLSKNGLVRIPIKFGVITGNFNVSDNDLKTLDNSPILVTLEFDCSENYNLMSLKNGPKKARNYICHNCDLTSLEGAPRGEIRMFVCDNNPRLTSLEFAPEKVSYIDCTLCGLKSLEGAPKSAGSFYCAKQVNGRKFTIADVRAVCNVDGEIEV
jgi:hypothetical protein